jgi:stearoyl-CoA 9-desaturase NADPH oxidoreductase
MSRPMHRSPARFAQSAWRRWFLDRTADFWLGELRATWSLSEQRARVVAIRDETDDTKTFEITTPRSWPGHRAGQYVPIEVEIDGVRVRRCYSISSGASEPGRQRIAITVKRVPGGRVSTWMHACLAAGDVVRLGVPAGDFTVEAPPARLLLVGAGSGVTPIAAIARDLVARGEVRDVVVIEAARTDADAIFAIELAELSYATVGLRVISHRGPLTADVLRPHVANREVYVCGPSPVMDLVTELAPRAHVERFATPRPATSQRARIHLALADRTVDITGGTLLEALERAGERPAYGCRMGICNTCRCQKTSGTVEDALTGALSSEPQEIRLCTSIARSDLELAL